MDINRKHLTDTKVATSFPLLPKNQIFNIGTTFFTYEKVRGTVGCLQACFYKKKHGDTRGYPLILAYLATEPGKAML